MIHQWRKCNSLIQNKIWDLVPLPKGKKLVRCKWIYRTKFAMDGLVDKRPMRKCPHIHGYQYGLVENIDGYQWSNIHILMYWRSRKCITDFHVIVLWGRKPNWKCTHLYKMKTKLQLKITNKLVECYTSYKLVSLSPSLLSSL